MNEEKEEQTRYEKFCAYFDSLNRSRTDGLFMLVPYPDVDVELQATMKDEFCAVLWKGDLMLKTYYFKRHNNLFFDIIIFGSYSPLKELGGYEKSVLLYAKRNASIYAERDLLIEMFRDCKQIDNQVFESSYRAFMREKHEDFISEIRKII